MHPWTFEDIVRHAGFIPISKNNHYFKTYFKTYLNTPIVFDNTYFDGKPKLYPFKKILSTREFLLVYFWSYDCENCLETLGDASTLDRESPIHFFPIHPEEGSLRTVILKTLNEIKFKGGFGIDLNGILAERLSVTSFPSAFLFSKKGTLIGYNNGHIDIKSFGFDILTNYMKKNITEEMIQQDNFATCKYQPANKILGSYKPVFSIVSVLTLITCITLQIKKRLFWF